jgi:hypothetical protein
VPLFERELEQEANRLVEAGKLKRAYLDEYGRHMFRLEAEKIFNIILKVTDSNSPIFISSLCRHSENSHEYANGLLSQWRGYGPRGGCAIELDEQALKDMIAAESQSYAYSHVSLKDVIYRDYQSAFDLNQVEGLAAIMLRLLAESTPENMKQYSERAGAIYGALALTAPTLKSEGFIEEREVRIIAPLMRPKAAREFPDRKQRTIHTRFRNGMPVPYIRLFEGVDQLPIRRIVVGPQRGQDKIQYALELALEAKGIAATVAPANIGYLPD